MENEKLITVLAVTYPHEAAIIRGRLEWEGIPCFVRDEFTVQVHPFYSNAIGGIRIQVLKRDLEQAREILKETGYINDEGLQSSHESSQINQYTNNPHITDRGDETICPVCGSTEVTRIKKFGWLFLLASLFAMYPAPFLKKKYYCFDCKREFKPEKQ